MDEQLVSEGSGGWDDARIERALFASGLRVPPLSGSRKAEVLNALLVETARLAAAAQTNSLAQAAQDTSPETVSSSAIEPALNEPVIPAFSDNKQADWSDSRIERTLLASGHRISPLKDARRAEMLAALMQETNRLAEQAKANAPRQPNFLERLTRLFSPRLVTALGGSFALLLAAFAYILLGGARPASVASAQGSFALGEQREGPFGIQWQLPRSYANANGLGITPGDELTAQTPVTITYANGEKTVVAAVGSTLRVLPDNALELVKGEILADTKAQFPDDQFKVAVNGVSTTFVVTDANFRIKVDDAGVVSQFTDQGKVLAATPNGMVEVTAGEQASLTKDGLPEKSLQPPVVDGTKQDDGALAFNARVAPNSTVIVIDTQTGRPLASFQADENGIVSGIVNAPPGTTTASIGFKTQGQDGQQSQPAQAVSDGNSISAASTSTVLQPAPVQVPTSYSVPALSLPAPAAIQATNNRGAAVTFVVAATDSIDGDLPVTCSATSGTIFPLGATSVTCSATNSQGRTAAGSFTVQVVDTTPPTLVIPADRTVSTTSNNFALTFAATATDTVDGALTPQCSVASGTLLPVGQTTVTCSVADRSNNIKEGSFVVLVRDAAPPSLQVPGALSFNASGRNGADVTFDATANDMVDGPITPVCTPRSGTTFAMGTTTVTCVATDKAGNATNNSFAVTVRDASGPVINVPTSPVVQATGPNGASVPFDVTANDVVDGPITPVCTPKAGATFGMGDTTVTCRATDAAGNAATSSFTVKVVDTTAPVVNVPGTLTAAAIAANGAPVAFTVTAADAVDGAIAPVCTPRSGSVFPIGSTTVTCRATDSHGTQGSATFSVVVRDTTNPIISLPDAITIEAIGPSGATVPFNATAKDAVDGVLTPTCSLSPGATFPLGKTMVRCTATDKAGNSAAESFLVTVVDTKAPVIKVPDNLSAKATGKTGASVTFAVTATDIVDVNVTPVCTPRSGALFGFGPTAVTCRATDNAGNSSSASFKVTVLDTTPPVLSLPSNQTAEATGPNGAPVQFTVAASDTVDGAIAPVCDFKPGATFPLGTTTVNCRATDDAGNIDTGSFNVSVRDTTAPDVASIANQTLEATSKAGAVVNFAASATDKVDGKIDPVCTTRPGAALPLGTTTVTCRATDKAGNSDSASFSVVVRDSTGPVLASLSDLKQEATSGAGAVVNFSPTATDAVDGPVAPVCTPKAGVTFPLGSTTVTCRASDAAGNVTTNSFSVAVADTTKPTLNLPPEPVVSAKAGGTPVNFTVTATDLVDGSVTVGCTPASGSPFSAGKTTVTCTATDRAGNTASGSFAVTVVDNTAPQVFVPASSSVFSNNPAGAALTFAASAVDDIDGPLTPVCSPASGATFGIGTTTVTCTATDKAGNVGSASFQITVVLLTPTPTNTPVPPTLTPTPLPTNTPVPPTNTPVPTETPVPPTPTPTPTNTPVPPTNTPVPTETPVPPTLTPTPTNTPVPTDTPTATAVPSATTATDPTPSTGSIINQPDELGGSVVKTENTGTGAEATPTPTPTGTPEI